METLRSSIIQSFILSGDKRKKYIASQLQQTKNEIVSTKEIIERPTISQIVSKFFYKKLKKDIKYPEKPDKECEINPKDITSCSYGNVGGHGNISDYDSEYCAKKILRSKENKEIIKDETVKEMSFYETIYQLNNLKYTPNKIRNLFHIISFIPKPLVDDIALKTCYRNNDIYFNLKNIKAKMGNDITVGDLKIGRMTAIYPDVKKSKEARMEAIDKLFSLSDKFGFRCEGVSGSIGIVENTSSKLIIENVLTKQKYQLIFEGCEKQEYCNKYFLQKLRLLSLSKKKEMKFKGYILNTMLFFKILFRNKNVNQLRQFRTELIAFKEACETNEKNIKALFEEKENSNGNSDLLGVSMIGSSLLLASGDTITFAPIDFAHSYFITKDYIKDLSKDEINFESWKELHLKASQNYTFGISNLVDLLSEYIDYYNDKIKIVEIK
jgi:hypothetical protein